MNTPCCLSIKWPLCSWRKGKGRKGDTPIQVIHQGYKAEISKSPPLALAAGAQSGDAAGSGLLLGVGTEGRGVLLSHPLWLSAPAVMSRVWHRAGKMMDHGAAPAATLGGTSSPRSCTSCAAHKSPWVLVQYRIYITPHLLCWFCRAKEEWEVVKIYFGH